jgi:parvulin-like peptidyl-prolyl isomerase
MRRYSNIRALPGLACAVVLACWQASALTAEDRIGSQILVTVGERSISALQLEQAIRSSPLATKFNILDEHTQADIRGSILKDLIYSEMLYQEGLAQKIDQRPEVIHAIDNFRRGALYQRYLSSLRQSMTTSAAKDVALKRELLGEPDARAAARAAANSKQFAGLKAERLLTLGREQNLRVYLDRLVPGERNAETLVAEGNDLSIRLGDLVYTNEQPDQVEGAELLRRLDNRVEQELMVQAAQREGMDVRALVEDYRENLVRQTVMKEREGVWVPDRAALEAYYQAHPELSRVPETWHVAQLVSETRNQAEDLRRRIVAGESLYRLASEYSIDPYGREHAGDMGWVHPDQAPAALRDVLKELPDGILSPVIETPMGFHLVTVEERKPGEQKPLVDVAGGIRRSLILEHLAKDYDVLSQRYPIKWNLPDHKVSGQDRSR